MIKLIRKIVFKVIILVVLLIAGAKAITEAGDRAKASIAKTIEKLTK